MKFAACLFNVYSYFLLLCSMFVFVLIVAVFGFLSAFDKTTIYY